MHYYQFNIGDYAKRTRHLSNLEDLAYRRLIDLYYTNESPLPDDIKQIARLITLRENVEEITNVLGDFFILENGFWTNKRADEEIANYHSKADAARANGKKGGRPKKPNPNPEETQPVILANPEETGSKAKQEPVTSNQEPVTKKQEPTTQKGEWTPPENLNIEAWEDFEEHRKTTKGKFSDLARTKAANVIKDLPQAEQQATIDRSIQSGWPGLFPDKNKAKVTQDISTQVYKEGSF